MIIRKKLHSKALLFPAISSSKYTDTTTSIVQGGPESILLSEGETLQLTAIVRDSVGFILAGETVTWHSANAGVASVSGSGLLTAVANGTTTISATDGAVSSIDLTVLVCTASDTLTGCTLSFFTGPKPLTVTDPTTGDNLLNLMINSGDACYYLDTDGNKVHINRRSLVGTVGLPGTVQSARLTNDSRSVAVDFTVGGLAADIVVNPGDWLAGDVVEIDGISLLEEIVAGSTPGFFSRLFDKLFG